MGVLNELVNYQVKVEGGDKASNFKINCLYFFNKYRKSDKFVERIPVAKIRTGGFYFLHYLDDSNWIKWSPIFAVSVKRFDNLNAIQLKNSLILDLGANRGDFSKWALDQGASVIAFEPDKDAYLQLIKRLNKFENFFPLNSAVSNKTALSKFYFHKNKKIDPIGFSISSSLLEEKANINN